MSTAVTTITMRPLIGMSIESVGFSEPMSQSGRTALTSFAPNTDLKICCMIRLKPQVASRVSSGRLYSLLTMNRSTTHPPRCCDHERDDHRQDKNTSSAAKAPSAG